MTAIPKKRKVYVKEDGTLTPLDKVSGAGVVAMYASSGTLLSDGHVTLSGSQFKTDSVIVPSYYDASKAGSAPMAVYTASAYATFYGDASQSFFFVLVNKSPVTK
jgi:hypothetical protein